MKTLHVFGILALLSLVLTGCLGGQETAQTVADNGTVNATNETPGAAENVSAGANETVAVNESQEMDGTEQPEDTGAGDTEAAANDTADEETGQAPEAAEGINQTDANQTNVTENKLEAVEPEVWGGQCKSDGDCPFSDDRCLYGTCVTPRCARLSECPVGTEFCFDGECVMKSDIYAVYEGCDSHDEYCDMRCSPTCVERYYRCISSGTGDRRYSICVQCAENADCEAGYYCIHYECVKP
ncbi:MAG: hypothetical protein PHV13_06255 [Candidatus ainarchaeum sp.]|nr:hypothetical protein [Candidatus ainarchaeum sp.]